MLRSLRRQLSDWVSSNPSRRKRGSRLEARALRVEPLEQRQLLAVWNVGPGESIQAAIDAADSGDTVNVLAGTYVEQVIVTKPLTLRGATHSVDKSDDYPVPEGYAWTGESVISRPDGLDQRQSIVVIKDTDDVVFEGFVVHSLSAGASSRNDHLVELYANSQTLDNIVVRNNVIGPNTNVASQDGTHGRMGLYIRLNRADYGLTNSTITQNKIFGAEGNGNNVFIWGAYESYAYSQSAPMTGTALCNNDIHGSHRSGIELAGGVSDLTISGNKIHDNRGLPGDPPDALKHGNGIVIIRGSSDVVSGPDALGADHLTISANQIYDNGKNGIYLGPINTDYTIVENTICDNGWDGIRLDLEGTYHASKPDHAQYGSSTGIAAHLNSIFDNGGYGARVIGTPTNGFVLDAQTNWWGHATGPYHPDDNPRGTGDAVSDHVDFDAWIQAAAWMHRSEQARQKANGPQAWAAHEELYHQLGQGKGKGE